jgi:hypothetical protein
MSRKNELVQSNYFSNGQKTDQLVDINLQVERMSKGVSEWRSHWWASELVSGTMGESMMYVWVGEGEGVREWMSD